MKTKEQDHNVSHFEAEKKGKIAIPQAMDIASTIIWNVLKKKETTGVSRARYRVGWPRKTTMVNNRNIVKVIKKNPKTTTYKL